MGLNFRKILNVGGGFRINLSKRGIGASAGVPGVRFGLGPKGKRLQISIPGTGIYYRKDEGWTGQSHGSSASLAQVVRRGFIILALIGLMLWLVGLLL